MESMKSELKLETTFIECSVVLIKVQSLFSFMVYRRKVRRRHQKKSDELKRLKKSILKAKKRIKNERREEESNHGLHDV